MFASIFQKMLTDKLPHLLAGTTIAALIYPFGRQSPTVLALADALGLASEQRDALFIAAAQIEA